MAKKRLNIFIILGALIIILFLFLTLLNWSNIKEGITAQQAKDEHAANTNVISAARKPKSVIKPINFEVTLSDTTTPYDSVTSHYKYLISATSEAAPTQNTTPSSFTVGNSPTTISLPMETSSFYSYIVVAPDSQSKFPKSFTFTLANDIQATKIQIFLWGSNPTTLNVPSNGIVGYDNITSYPYPPDVYSISPPKLMIAGVDIGNDAMNIINSAPVFNRAYTQIADVSYNDSNTVVVCTDSTNITGMLIYLGKPSSGAPTTV
jgi:hypothetical protein